MHHIEKLIPDTSVIIEALVSAKLKAKEFKADEIIIHEAVLAELEHQANQGRVTGLIGLDEIENLRKLSKELDFKFKFKGTRPSAGQIKYASLGEMDAFIRDLAYDEDATLITADKVQAKVASAKGIKFILIEQEKIVEELKIEKYFDEQTMSVHLREGIPPYSKKGMPGNWEMAWLSEEPLKQEFIKDAAREIVEEARIRKDGFVEIERAGSTIVQLGRYRIVITKPPFSDGWEITAVRPIKQLSLEDYNPSEKLKLRIEKQAEGILIAGAPGHGKSTFAQALAEFFANRNKVVKTVEAPRDLIVSDKITQYSVTHGSIQEIHDVLLLTRPDYTIYDEMRNTHDFLLFSDMRLAGVGMVGVMHATDPVDAIQRFIGRIELGVIPHVINTVLFIKNGTVHKILSLKMVVKVPSGMSEADLARPVVVVNDFETNKPEFEIYTYGEQTVVVPISAAKASPLQELAKEGVRKYFMRFTNEAEVEFASDNKAVVYVPERDIPAIIGKQGKTIEKIEEALGLSIDIQEKKRKREQREKSLLTPNYNKMTDANLCFYFDKNYANSDVDIYINNDYLMSGKIGMKGVLKLNTNGKLGKSVLDYLNSGKEIMFYLV